MAANKHAQLTRADLAQPRNVRGLRVGTYRLEQPIARGGMGMLFRASLLRDLVDDPRGLLPDEVALKIVLPRRAQASALDIGRFMKEISSLIRIDHPHVVRIFDANKHQDLHYYTMELVYGKSLKQLAPLPPLMALSTVRATANALATLHQSGLLHRDVKPANVLLDRSYAPFRAVLIDFGLICANGSSPGLAGTPAYMSPEQAVSGTPLSPATDLYGLGATLYYLLTGRPPFAGKTAESILKKVRGSVPPLPSKVSKQTPASLDGLTMALLAKDPDDRPVDATELLEELDDLIERAQKTIRTCNSQQRLRRWLRLKPLS